MQNLVKYAVHICGIFCGIFPAYATLRTENHNHD